MQTNLQRFSLERNGHDAWLVKLEDKRWSPTGLCWQLSWLCMHGCYSTLCGLALQYMTLWWPWWPWWQGQVLSACLWRSDGLYYAATVQCYIDRLVIYHWTTLTHKTDTQMICFNLAVMMRQHACTWWFIYTCSYIANCLNMHGQWIIIGRSVYLMFNCAKNEHHNEAF